MDPILPFGDPSDLLVSLELFRAVPLPVLREMVGVLREHTIPGGVTLIHQGATDDSLYVVVSGRLKTSILVEDREQALAEIGPGELVGEIAFLTGQVRSAVVSAQEGSRVLQLTRTDFEVFELRYPEAAASMLGVLSQRLKRSQLGTGLRQTGLFGTLEESVLRALESALELVTLRGGETLFQQGELGDSLYVVISGRLRVVVEVDGEERAVAELGHGETVGEMAVLGGERRSATVYAVRDTNLARLSREDFDHYLAKYPQTFAPIFTRKIVARLQAQISGAQFNPDRLNTIAVAPASVDVDLESFCARLTAALSRHGRCLHLNASRCDELLWRGASDATEQHDSNTVIVARLGALETDHRYVVYQTDAIDSPWTRRCTRQADHVLLVGSGSADPQPRAAEQVIHAASGARRAKQSLVLLHPDGSRLPSGTGRWLALRDVDAHYHVRLDGEGDFDRLARVLTRNAIGLVLGGGFARAIGHAGVVRALEELSIPVDFVGGTSMGAIMAAEYLHRL